MNALIRDGGRVRDRPVSNNRSRMEVRTLPFPGILQAYEERFLRPRGKPAGSALSQEIRDPPGTGNILKVLSEFKLLG